MICRPFSVEQMANCWYACTGPGIRLELNVAENDEGEKLVRELIEGENGTKLRVFRGKQRLYRPPALVVHPAWI